METISNYLETMFKTLPQTAEILRMKEELLLNEQINPPAMLGRIE